MRTTRPIAGHRRVEPRRRGRAAVVATGLVAAVALSSGSGAEAATPTVTYNGLCVLGVANILSPSPSSVSLGAGGSVEVVNKATALLGGASLVVTSGTGQTVKLGPGARTVITYPELTSVKTYTLSGKCAAVNLSAPVGVTVAAAPQQPADPGSGSGGGSGSGSGGSGSGSGGTGSGGTGSGGTGTGSHPGGTGSTGGGPVTVPGARPATGGALPPGFANPPVALSAPGAGNLPIPDVTAAVPGAPGEASAPDGGLFGPGTTSQSGADAPKRLAAVQHDGGNPTTRMLLIIVAMVLFLGVGTAALRAVRDSRLTSVAART